MRFIIYNVCECLGLDLSSFSFPLVAFVRSKKKKKKKNCSIKVMSVKCNMYMYTKNIYAKTNCIFGGRIAFG